MNRATSLRVLGPLTVWIAWALSTTAAMVAKGNDNIDGQSASRASMHKAFVSDYPVGDVRRCVEKSTKDMQTFEVLPGHGWDNLRNVDEGQVVVFTYSQCRTTEDGRFLLPDSVSAVPVKVSHVQTFAEFITHWKSWTSTTSRSINVEAGLSLSKFSISGKFSSDFEDIKSKQIGDKSVTTRAQLRYIRYGVQLQPDTPLHPVFRNRVLSIAAAQELGEEERARYLAQLLVRDFGTHVVTKADAGAALEQVDQLKEDWVNSQQEHKSEILLSASASLFGMFHMDASYDAKTDQTFLDNYRSQRTSSSIFTRGGPLFRPANFTPDAWAAEVDRDLVALDRSGDPLFYVLTGSTLPELPSSTLNEVYQRVKEAVETYHSYNTIPGCLQPKSPNFCPSANTDDSSCKPPPANLTFGGVFQTCVMNPGSSNGDLCGGLTQVNPLTGGFSCPANYRSIQLHSGTTSSSRSQHVCQGHWFWKRCHDDYYRSKATYTMLWCVATGGVPPHSGYLFGGLFTSHVLNPVTQAATCPPTFFPLSIGSKADLHVCISDDYEFGEAYSLPFAGFISCKAGNPLAVADLSGQGQGRRKVRAAESDHEGMLKLFFQDQADGWPMRCPDGFSRHLATVDQGCQINYCVQTGSMAGPVLPTIKRPPFMAAPPVSAPSSDNLVIFDPATNTWKRNLEASLFLSQSDFAGQSSSEGSMSPAAATNTWKQNLEASRILSQNDVSGQSSSSGSSMSPGVAAGISVGATLGCVIVATLAVLAVRAKRRRARSGYRRLENPLLDPQNDYGSVNTAEPAPASTSVNLAAAQNAA